jgi:hypothetical protein
VEKLCPPNLLKEFGEGDGGKFYCDTNFHNEEDCIIFSIGSMGNYDFERAVVKNSKFCKVHTFDCTGHYSAPSDLRSRVEFHKICIGGNEDKKKNSEFKTYKEMLELTAASNLYIPKYFKMDIEGYEFNVFRSMFQDITVRKYLPEQIAFELHASTQMKDLSWSNRYKLISEIDHFMLMLKKVGGYEVVNIDHNPWCRHCTELVVMRDVSGSLNGEPNKF